MADYIILIIAAFAGGVLNTIAGGGTFLTFPALVYVGVPPVMANATATFMALPGYLAGAAGFKDELKSWGRPSMIRLTIVAAIGGGTGALLLSISSNEAFSLLVPFLLLAASLIFTFGDRIRKIAANYSRDVKSEGVIGIFAVSLYGGYFNGGLGIVFLALFTMWGMQNIHLMNGLKLWASGTIAVVSFFIFAQGGLLDWEKAIIMMIAGTIGGYLGAPLARSLPIHRVKQFISFVGFSMTAIFFARLIF
ncbi:MAG: sulfite exporter TauE/SafE family protein [Paracoccaceae bacterium]|jgi:uncharacterized protein|nr:sulfite exporter TauE/SafE family protein [Paracoccaceae bacterium]